MIEWQEAVDGIVVVTLINENLTASNAAELRAQLAALADTGQTRLVLDFNSVRYVDSSGLGALVGVLKRVGAKGELALCRVAPAVMSVFKLTRMDKVFSIYPDPRTAVEGLSQ